MGLEALVEGVQSVLVVVGFVIGVSQDLVGLPVGGVELDGSFEVSDGAGVVLLLVKGKTRLVVIVGGVSGGEVWKKGNK
jgi:hypothetical protein